MHIRKILKTIFIIIVSYSICNFSIAANFPESGFIVDKTTGCKFFLLFSKDKDGTWSGNCKNGFAEGVGVLSITLKGDFFGKYEVNMVSGKINGKGKIFLSNGITYDGEIKDNQIHGQGSLLMEGNKYVGEFREGFMYGKGDIIYLNGDTYSGEVKKFLKDGQGILTYKNGAKITGEFVNDQPTRNAQYHSSPNPN